MAGVARRHRRGSCYVKRDFRRYVECGMLAHGFARARCAQCGHYFLTAFSCKGRGVCPSCNTRRMVTTAAHLTDHVLPPLPLRQWVLAVPERLRCFLERDTALQGVALRLFLATVEHCLRAHCPGSPTHARIGTVAFIHRLKRRAQRPLHFHCVVIDGVFAPAPTRDAVFHPATALDPHHRPRARPAPVGLPDAARDLLDPQAQPAPAYEFDQRVAC